MADRNIARSRKRFRLVLVPGFAGFDALGQLEYYAAITPLFRAWNAAKPVVLNYFDNFPTAAVAPRAFRLHRYLARQILRGEISSGDQVTLVGHSTGGLDIRQLMLDLHRQPDEPIHGRRRRQDGRQDNPRIYTPRRVPFGAPMGHEHCRLGAGARDGTRSSGRRVAGCRSRFTSTASGSDRRLDHGWRGLPHGRGIAAGRAGFLARG